MRGSDHTLKLHCSLPECLQVFPDVIPHRLRAVLHDEPGVFKGNDFTEEFMLRVERKEKLFIFARAEAKADVGHHPDGNLLPYVLNNEFIYGGGQVRPVIVIVVLFPAAVAGLCESQGAHRGDVEAAVELLRSAIGPDHLIDKDR